MLNEAARGSNIRLGMNPTASQLEAIHAPHGHLQLIACAGSGKTEVVARRVVELLRPRGGCALEPRNVLAFTFTERAAAELKERITTRVRESLGEVAGLAEMFVGTIHGFCLDLLRREAPVFLGYNVLDEVAQRMLIERHPERSGFRAARLVTGDELVPWRDTGVYIKALDVLRQGDVDPARLHGVTAAEGLRAWRELLEDRRCLDYTAILEHAVRLLTEDAGVGARIRARVRHVIVDEYQDVNPIQERVVRALAGLGAWLCVVGDDDQSIYQWNGASVTNILRFAERYPDVRTVRLQENFRSSRAIVELARAFIAQNRERLPKAMVSTDAQPTEAGDILARAFRTPREEAAWVAERFAALRGTPFQDGSRSRGLAWSDLCVLVRGNLRQTAAPLVEAFKTRGIPYLVSGLNNLFETPEAHASAALFRFVAGAEGVELDALRNAWHVALPAVDPEALERALDYARAVQDEVAYDADEDAHALLPQRVFLEFLAQLGLREESAGGGGHGEAIFANLGVFSRVLQDFETIHHHTAAAAKYAQLVAFLGNVAKDQYAEGALDGALARPDAVRILTVHKAKGLQWPAVALVGLIEGRFPARRFAQDPRRKKFKDWWDLVPVEAVADGARYQGDLDDERRLFYVAITRAQRWLMLSFAPSEQYSWQNKPSSFFRWACARPEVSTGDITPRAVERLPPSPRHGVDGVQLDFTTIKHLFECPRRFQFQALKS